MTVNQWLLLAVSVTLLCSALTILADAIRNEHQFYYRTALGSAGVTLGIMGTSTALFWRWP